MHPRTLLLAIALAGPAFAADAVVDMPNDPDTGKAIPRPVLLLDNPKYVWVAAQGYRPLRTPAAKAEPAGGDPLPFLDMCGVAARWQGDREYLLLAKGSPGTAGFRLLGWVDINLCVLRNAALTTRDEIARKAMIVNTARTAAEAAQLQKEGKAFFDVPVLLAPDPASPRASKDPFRLFNIYFVYADSEPANPDGGYFLLGQTHEFSAFEAQTNPEVPRRVVLGWVSKHRVCRWDTREAVELNADPDRRFPAEIYMTPEEALKALRERDEVRAGKKPSVQPLFQEVFRDGKPVERPYDEMRFPLIPVKRDELIRTADGGELQFVGFVGDYIDPDGKTLLSKEKVSRLRKVMDRVDAELAVTELMFVVDFTSSMEAHVLATAETIEAILKSVRKQQEAGGRSTVRVGLALYSDLDAVKRPKLDDTVKVYPLTPIDDPAVTKWVAELRARAKARQLDEGGDNREQMFHGLKQGIAKAGFSRYARKMVVLIGDYGSKRASEKDEDDIASGLAPLGIDPDTKKPVVEQSPIDFFACQVQDPAKDKGNDDLGAFATQMKKVIELYDVALEKVNLKDPARREYIVVVDPEEMGRLVLKRYESMRKQGGDVRAELDKLQRGQFRDVKIGPELDRILRREGEKIGVDVEQFIKSAGMQIFSFGHVWQMSEPKVRQTRLKYLVSGGDVRPVLKALERLVSSDYEEFEKQETAESFARLLVGVAAGEDPTSPLGVRLKAKGLRTQSPLLARSLDAKDVKFDLVSRQELEDIRLRALRLEDAVSDRKFTYRPVKKRTAADEELIKWERAGDPASTPRRFRLYGNERDSFYWVDFEREWP